MGAAGDDGKPRGRHGAAGNGAPFIVFFEECADPLGAGKQPRQRRRQNHPQGRVTVFDQGNVHGEFAVAVDELLGAVQGVDQPKSLRHGRYAAGGRRLLGNHGNGGRELRERRKNDRLGPLICRGDRRGIGLVSHFKICRIDLENGLPCRPRHRQHLFEKFSAARNRIHAIVSAFDSAKVRARPIVRSTDL